jgi:hypothetical protein
MDFSRKQTLEKSLREKKDESDSDGGGAGGARKRKRTGKDGSKSGVGKQKTEKEMRREKTNKGKKEKNTGTVKTALTRSMRRRLQKWLSKNPSETLGNALDYFILPYEG